MTSEIQKSYRQIISTTKKESELIQSLSSKLASSIFHEVSTPLPRKQSLVNDIQYIYKSKAYDLYTHCFKNLVEEYDLDHLEPMTKAHFGKVMTKVFNCQTKRIGSRNKSYYAYCGLAIDKKVKDEYEEVVKTRWIENGQKNDEVIRRNRIELLKFLNDEKLDDCFTLHRCDLILWNFESFNVVQMRKDWKSINLQEIISQGSGAGCEIPSYFEVLDIFNIIPDHLNIVDIEMALGMNHLKINIINKIMEILNYNKSHDLKSMNNYLTWQFISTRFLEQLTFEKSSSFGSFWILKCLFDELIPFIQKTL